MLPRHVSVLALPLLLAACPGSDGDPPPVGGGQLVVGIQGDDFGGLVEEVHVVATIGGVITSDQTLKPSQLPKEVLIEGASGARAEIVVEATTSQPPSDGLKNGGNIVVSKRAATQMFPTGKKLLRMQLETRCVTFSAPGGGAPAPTCAAPQTCASARCVSEEVPFDQLETYETTWASSPPDSCRPANHGAPELFLGTGQTDFAPLNDGQTLMLERGPQGGHHIWIATRMKNLRQSGSRTTLSAKLVDDPTSPILPAGYVFTYDRDEGNYCKLWGLRFQLDSGATDLGGDYKRFLGKKLEITVEVIDSTNAKASVTKTIQIADKLLCPDGTTTSCN